MVEIGRGTTPKMIFKAPFKREDLETAYVTFSQGGIVVLEKDLDDFVFTDNGVQIEFSQEDTLALDEDRNRTIEVQLRYKCVDGSAFRSKIKTATVGRILKDGII